MAANIWDSGGGANQNWALGLNWDDNNVPGTTPRAYINNGGTAQISDVRQIGAVTIGQNAGNSGTLTINAGGSLTTTTTASGSYSYVGQLGSGNLNLFGGSFANPNTQLHVGVGSAAVGAVSHTGGSLSTRGLLLADASGSNATYTLSGAASTVHSSSSLWVGYGGTGQFTQSAGAVTVAGELRIGDLATGDGTYELSGGTVAVTGQTRIAEAGGAKGKVIQTGGSLSSTTMVLARFADAEASYAMSGASSALNLTGELYVGHQGAGTMVQTDGTVNVGTNLRIGESTGGVGKYDISGGNINASVLVLSRAGTATGELNISGTANVDIASNAFIAYTNIGTVNQTGGTVKIGGNMILTNSSGANGTYNLQGGVLDMDGGIITRTAGSTANFNFTGGRLEDVGTFNGNLLQQGGTLAAGNSPGIMNITGDYTLGSAATLEVEIFGDNPTIPEFDRYLVGGNAVLNGTLTLLGNDRFETDLDVFENMFFDVLTADTITIGPTFNLNQSGFAFANGLYELFDYEVVDIGGGQQSLRLSLLAVPEPAGIAVWGMGGILGLGGIFVRRGQRKVAMAKQNAVVN